MIFKLSTEIQQEIAKKAKNLRKQYKLTQSDLAEQCGVTLSSLKRFEQSGKISLSSLLKIAQRLDALEDFERLFSKRKKTPGSIDEILKKEQE